MSMKCDKLINSTGCNEVPIGCMPVYMKMDKEHPLIVSADFAKPPKKPFDWYKFLLIVLILIDIGVNVYACFWR